MNKFREPPPLKSPKYIKRTRTKRIVRVILALAFFLAIIGGLSYFSRYPLFVVSSIIVSGNAEMLEEDLRSAVEKNLEGNVALVFARKSAMFYPKKAMEASLLKAFPRVERVAVSRRGLNTLSVEATVRTPYALWCGTEKNPARPNDSGRSGGDEVKDCFFIDNQGLIFAPAPSFSGEAYFVFFGGVFNDPIGSQYLSRGNFENINQFIKQLRNDDIPVYALLHGADGDYTAFLKNQTGDESRILFSTEDSLETTLHNLEVLWKEKKLGSLGGGTRLNYIDVRFGNKLYYTVKQ